MADMATNPELLGVRDTLKNKYNIADERIGWDGQYVTIDGKQAIKPTQNVDSRALADSSAIATAAPPFQQMQAAGAGAAANGGIAQQLGGIQSELAALFPQAENGVDQQFNELLETLSGRVANRTPITLAEVLANPMYAAQSAQIGQQAQHATRAAQEALGASGFGRSTRLQDRARAIQNDASNFLNTQAVPVIMQAMQAEQDRGTTELLELLGVLGQERQFQETSRNNDIMQALELLGFQTGREDVAFERDYRQGRDAVADKQYAEQVAYQQARDAIADERWKIEFDEDARRHGLDYALQQALRQDHISADAADRALRSRGLDLEERSLNLREDEAAKAQQNEFTTERQGLATAIRSGQMTPGQALQQIEEDEKLGFYTPEQAALLKQDLKTIAANATPAASMPEETAAVESFRSTIPSDKDIEAEARRFGYPTLDYRSYYKDPKGKMAGISFEQWVQLYGPKLG